VVIWFRQWSFDNGHQQSKTLIGICQLSA